LLPLNAAAAGGDEIIEAHIPAQLFHDLGLQTNEILVLTPRKARVFVA
jgi:sulfate transport system ATP-binding protein